MDACLL